MFDLSRKEKYLNTLQIGSLIAFENDEKNKYESGKIISIVDNNHFIVETAYGVQFHIERNQIRWVKTGPRWPKGVYQMLKGENKNVKEKQKEIL